MRPPKFENGFVSQNGCLSRAPADPAQITVGSFRKMVVCLERPQIPHSLPLASFGAFALRGSCRPTAYRRLPTGRRIPHKLKSGSFGAFDVAAHVRKCLPFAGPCSEGRSNRQASTEFGRLAGCARERAAPNRIMPDEFGGRRPIEHLDVIGENDCSALIDSPFPNGCLLYEWQPRGAAPGQKITGRRF
jgi:hypothetical protein